MDLWPAVLEPVKRTQKPLIGLDQACFSYSRTEDALSPDKGIKWRRFSSAKSLSVREIIKRRFFKPIRSSLSVNIRYQCLA